MIRAARTPRLDPAAEQRTVEALHRMTWFTTPPLKFLKKAMKMHGPAELFVTDKLWSHGAALTGIGTIAR